MSSRALERLLCILPAIAMLLALASPQAAAEPVSGRYGALSLVVRGGTVAGLFASERGDTGAPDAVTFSCLFLVAGRIANGAASVTTWYPGDPERIGGTLRFTPDGAALQLAAEPPGCGMAVGDMVREPYEERFDGGRPDWLDLGFVTAERAVLASRPNATPPRGKPYLVRFDPVAVVEWRGGWARVEFLGGETRTTGWLRDGEIGTAIGDGP